MRVLKIRGGAGKPKLAGLNSALAAHVLFGEPLAAVLDLHSRQVVGWSLQPHMHSTLVKDVASVS